MADRADAVRDGWVRRLVLVSELLPLMEVLAASEVDPQRGALPLGGKRLHGAWQRWRGEGEE